ncbi:MAG: polyisoprenoid-binding protein [Gemmatimonadetes bacterium]|nr:MAG: polyisoprenoid-binding protein [Gemmatimonadota bacterium]
MNRLVCVLATLACGSLAAQAPSATPAPQTAPPPARPASTNRWSADPAHSAVAFRVRHLGITWVNGSFGEWTADLNFDPAHAEAASVTAKIQSATITTGNDRRDTDLRQNYLAVDSFPEIRFVSKRVEKVAPDKLRISGDLTLRGVTRPVVLDADIGGVIASPMGRRAAFSATTTIKRQDYGITLNRFMEGAQIVGDDVRITIDIEARESATSP